MEAFSHANVWSDALDERGAWLQHDVRAPPHSCIPRSPALSARDTRVVFIVDADRAIRDATRALFEENGYDVQLFVDCNAFLRAYRPNCRGCLLIDESSLGTTGLEMLGHFANGGRRLPCIVMSACFTLPIAVETMRTGAFDLAEKPLYRAGLLASMKRAFALLDDLNKDSALRSAAAQRVAGLTERQRQILNLVVAGYPSKNIAVDLGVSLRTVDNHRARIAKRTSSKSLPALIRTAACGSCSLAGRSGQTPFATPSLTLDEPAAETSAGNLPQPSCGPRSGVLRRLAGRLGDRQ
jgi:two-component system CheB/CheR fusion protein